jgi:hypothetical protein
MNELIIKKRNNNIIDVFFGKTGWDDWACFKKEKNRLLLIKGSAVPNDIYKEIYNQVKG